MKRVLIPLATLAVLLPNPALANHIFYTGVPHETRGACEAEVARLSVEDFDVLLDTFPLLFSNLGEVASFLTRAFPCGLNPEDQQWYIEDHRLEVLSSGWFKRRL